MCDVCGSYICMCGCPHSSGLSYERGTPIADCDECGTPIYENDDYVEKGKFALCGYCADGIGIKR